MAKEQWDYDRRCRRCDSLNTWVLTSEYANPDIDIPWTISHYFEHPFQTQWCEKCGMETRQEFVAAYVSNPTP